MNSILQWILNDISNMWCSPVLIGDSLLFTLRITKSLKLQIYKQTKKIMLVFKIMVLIIEYSI